MRDLYQRLAIPPEANEQAIQHAVASCQHSALRQDAEAVFSVAERREAYDTLHDTVSDIGKLRARLGLSHGAHWQGDVANDFSLPPDHAISRHDELVDRVSHRLRGPWLLIAVFAAGAGIGIGLGLALCWGLLPV